MAQQALNLDTKKYPTDTMYVKQGLVLFSEA